MENDYAFEMATSNILACEDTSTLTIEQVTTLAHEGNPILKGLFRRAGEVLGLGISGLIQVFNPEKIMIAGEGVRAGDLLFKPMHEAIGANTSREMLESLQIIIQKWEDTDWARGAASLVLQELYKSPFNRMRPVI